MLVVWYNKHMAYNRRAPKEKRDKIYKLSPKMRNMIYHYLENGGKRAAYIHAYGKGNYSYTCLTARVREVFRYPQVVAEIEKLQKKHAERHNMTVDDLLNELEEARGLARKIEQPSSMVSATMGKAKILGMDNPKGGEADAEPQQLNISFEVREPVKKVKVTNAKAE